MSKRSFKDLVLVLIYYRNGDMGWYLLERAFDRRGIGGVASSVKVLDKLVEEGLIREFTVYESDTNITTYFLTAKGERKAKQLLEDLGPEIFAPAQQNRDDYDEETFGRY